MDIIHLAGSLYVHEPLDLTDIHFAEFPRLIMSILVNYSPNLSCYPIRDARTILEAFNSEDQIRSWYQTARIGLGRARYPDTWHNVRKPRD